MNEINYKKLWEELYSRMKEIEIPGTQSEAIVMMMEKLLESEIKEENDNG